MKEETLRLGNLTIENVTQRTVLIVGRKGWGKSQTLKMLAYSAPLELPCYIFDPLGKIEIEGFQRILITKTILKNEETLKQLPQLINKVKDKKIIFSFQEMLQEEIVVFMDAFFESWKPNSCLIFIDEMQDVTPNIGMGFTGSNHVIRAVRHWRNRNCGFVVATQRPADTSTKVIGLTDLMILGAISWKQDKKTIEEVLGDMLSEGELEQLMKSIQTKGFLEGYVVNFR